MRNFRNAAFGLIAAASLAAASDVHELKTDTFEPFVKENDLVLAEFFAPWYVLKSSAARTENLASN